MAELPNLTALQVIPASAADIGDILRLFGELHRYNAELDPRFELVDDWQELVGEYLEQSTDSDESAWLIARIGTRAVGFVLVEVHYDAPLYRHRRWAEIVGLYIEPEHRGRGIAKALMQHAYDWALQHHLGVMQLYVTASNQRAQRFYTQEGFTTSQLIMRCILSDDEQESSTSATQQAQRLHFSEGGARPLDMHARPRQHEPHRDRHSD